ncbi:MAG TPA: hypothetical protein VG816_11750, partial [Solirubrobacterales bacterium]|nr:hypothetical protein [Solirubrobacterales bacterium]
MQLAQPGDQAIRPGAEVAEAVLALRRGSRLGRWGRAQRRWRDRRHGGDPFLGVAGGDARQLGQLGRPPGLLGGIDRRRADRHHR